MLPFRLAASSAAHALHPASRIARRGNNDSGQVWFIVIVVLVAIVDFVVVVPVLVYLSYTVCKVFPVLAIVASHPSYELLPLQEANGACQRPDLPAPVEHEASAAAAPLSFGLRDLHHLVKQTDRFWLRRRGLFILGAYALANALAGQLLAVVPFVPRAMWRTVAALLTVQLHTVWVHVIITPPQARLFWGRILDFATVFRATAAPTVLYCAAQELAYYLPSWVALLFKYISVSHGSVETWTFVLQVSIYFATQVFVCLPALVALTRIQASLLPEDEDTIVPLDRTFGVERGKGGEHRLTIIQAWKSFKGSWKKLYILSIKIFFAVLAVGITICAIIGPEFLLFATIGPLLSASSPTF
ncbi:hypothetical protein F4802DRAFT_542333 [Xylaria palmicola]|nr:hypothetical protein F4802DRAFT_542333 [Xylaria palmicola]